MTYRFICPKCGRETELRMRIEEYQPDGHICECGAELVRDPKDFCTNYSVSCGGFYAEYQSK